MNRKLKFQTIYENMRSLTLPLITKTLEFIKESSFENFPLMENQDGHFRRICPTDAKIESAENYAATLNLLIDHIVGENDPNLKMLIAGKVFVNAVYDASAIPGDQNVDAIALLFLALSLENFHENSVPDPESEEDDEDDEDEDNIEDDEDSEEENKDGEDNEDNEDEDDTINLAKELHKKLQLAGVNVLPSDLSNEDFLPKEVSTKPEKDYFEDSSVEISENAVNLAVDKNLIVENKIKKLLYKMAVVCKKYSNGSIYFFDPFEYNKIAAAVEEAGCNATETATGDYRIRGIELLLALTLMDSSAT